MTKRVGGANVEIKYGLVKHPKSFLGFYAGRFQPSEKMEKIIGPQETQMPCKNDCRLVIMIHWSVRGPCEPSVVDFSLPLSVVLILISGIKKRIRGKKRDRKAR